MSDALNGRGYGRGDDRDPVLVVPYRYRVGNNPAPAFGPPHAVLDDKDQSAIALCWHLEKAQLIVDALNYPPLPRIPEL